MTFDQYRRKLLLMTEAFAGEYGDDRDEITDYFAFGTSFSKGRYANFDGKPEEAPYYVSARLPMTRREIAVMGRTEEEACARHWAALKGDVEKDILSLNREVDEKNRRREALVRAFEAQS